MENDADKNTLCCPNCGSTALSVDKKGFGTGKFVAGTLIAGPLVGVLAGGLGKNKREVYCLKCGRKYKPGSFLNGLITVEQYNLRNKNKDILKALGEGKRNKSEAIAELNNKRTPIKKHLELIEEKRKNMTVPCSKCGAEIRGDMKFCPHCGAAIEFTYAFFCPYCDVEIHDSKMKFCFNCGREFNTHTQHLQSETNTITYSTAASQPIESPTSFPTKTLPKPGCLLWIGAFHFPYFFIFSKHKSIKKFSLIWLIFIILFFNI